jgi:hypothetical protein
MSSQQAQEGASPTFAIFCPQFSMRDNVKVSVLLSPPLRGQMANYRNVVLIEREPPRDVAARFWFEQRHLPALIRQSGADVLLSAGNFALWNSPTQP